MQVLLADVDFIPNENLYQDIKASLTKWKEQVGGEKAVWVIPAFQVPEPIPDTVQDFLGTFLETFVVSTERLTVLQTSLETLLGTQNAAMMCPAPQTARLSPWPKQMEAANAVSPKNKEELLAMGPSIHMVHDDPGR